MDAFSLLVKTQISAVDGSSMTGGEFIGKRLQLLKELAPAVARVYAAPGKYGEHDQRDALRQAQL